MMIDDTDIRGLSAADARAYALEFATALKNVERELAALAPELETWARRVELAVQKGAADLEAAARARFNELSAKRDTLASEAAELKYKVSRIKEKLPLASAMERSVDADLLLATMQMDTGEALGTAPSPKLEKDLSALGVEDALAALKRKMAGDGPKE